MFDKTEYDGLNYLDVETKENLAVAKRASDESIVLLKNDGILPIDKNKNKVIAVIGPNADSRACLIGNYYGTSSEYIHNGLRGHQERRRRRYQDPLYRRLRLKHP